MTHLYTEGWGEDEGRCAVYIAEGQICGLTEEEHKKLPTDTPVPASGTKQYVFRISEVVKVSDGDTYWFQLDTGFRNKLLVHIRLNQFDTPEKAKGSPRERELAKNAQELAAQFLWTDRPDVSYWVKTEKDPEVWGRWLGDVWLERADGSELHLGDWLRQHQLASVWPTKWRDEFDV